MSYNNTGKIVVLVEYLDTHRGYRMEKEYLMPYGYSKSQVIYLLKKDLGFTYYKRFVRDVVTYEYTPKPENRDR